jgi:hypothetical protein
MDAVYDLGKILLVIQIRQFKNETLQYDGISRTQPRRELGANLWKANLPDEVEENINIV